ncbi:uncharacterized protein B0I36DRAFT_296662 [Microdochium trichocladiopsis]|uniref:MutL C-terminal dimerisation domain-containing protein n=1 Tax=Microdochium trichocladiopsis TaxID=1682393 RepID=A0A9P8XYZ9_9PEZI|nr:uncharacterized protein B0I36DRAFT_296662 [Microdochium trichocladiopsis]KAH7021143.1 hypothetical protein B0I36DRAFT_296662 [Microdochium trichocladiopsis]
MQQASSIHRLPQDAIAQIKSSAVIVSLSDAVVGLLENSLDAHATKINVSVDFARGTCTVDDNGCGILPGDFAETGGLGRLYHSSRFLAGSEAHGRHGTFLASLAALSLLTINSHHKDHDSHSAIRLYRAEVVARHVPASPEHRFLTYSHGTRVALRDLFGGMPVRIKQRAFNAERGLHAREFEQLKHDIAAVLLAWPGCVHVALRDASSGQTLSVRVPSINLQAPNQRGDVSSLAARLNAVLTSVQLSEEKLSGSWIELRASAGGLSVSGAVNLTPVATKRAQFVSIGIRPVRNSHGSNLLYEEINRIFADSAFGVVQNSTTETQALCSTPTSTREKANSGTRQEQKGRKALEKWPMFFLQLQIVDAAQQDEDHLLGEQSDSLSKIQRLLRAVLCEFLLKHDLQPRSSQPHTKTPDGRPLSTEPIVGRRATRSSGSRRRSSSPPRSRIAVGDLATARVDLAATRDMRARSRSPFSFWGRIKSGVASDSQQSMLHKSSPLAEANGSSRSEVSATESEPFLPPGLAPSQSPSTFQHRDDGGDPSCKRNTQNTITWMSPATDHVSFLDRRGGLLTQKHNQLAYCAGNRISDASRKYPLVTRPAETKPASPWLTDLISNWENPVFPSAELSIPAISSVTELQFDDKPPPMRKFSEYKVSKVMLSQAEAVSQVDRKFILAKLPAMAHATLSEYSLLMIDQHAADERCRVEALMREYFQPKRTAASDDTQYWKAVAEPLDQPLRFDISDQDAVRFAAAKSFFEHWAVFYSIKAQPRPIGNDERIVPQSLEITQLPPSILERCQSEPRLLIELLRAEALKLHESTQPLQHMNSPATNDTVGDSDTKARWLSRIQGCPRGILEMINSRACRSAIMFNDSLSLKECQELLHRLSTCAFPFQCAHGRPSVVPLVDIGLNGTAPFPKQNHLVSFRETYREWAGTNHKITEP